MASSNSPLCFLLLSFPALLLSIVLVSASSHLTLGHETEGGRRRDEGVGRRMLLSFRETPGGGNVTFDCSPSGPCIPCLYSEKGSSHQAAVDEEEEEVDETGLVRRPRGVEASEEGQGDTADVGPPGEELLEPVDEGEGDVEGDVLAGEGQGTPIHTPIREVEKDIEREISTDADLTVPRHLGEGEDEGEELAGEEDEGGEVDALGGGALEVIPGGSRDILQVSSDTDDDRDDAALAAIQQGAKSKGEASISIVDKGKTPLIPEQVANAEETQATQTPPIVGLSALRSHPGGRRRRDLKLEGMEQVESFWVKSKKAPLVRAIFAKYGNIAHGCEFLSFSMKSQCMSYLIFIVETLQSEKPESLTGEDIETIEDGLKDLARSGFRVDWLDAQVAPFRPLFKFIDAHMDLQDVEIDLKTLREQRATLDTRIADLEKQEGLLKARMVAAQAEVGSDLDIDSVMASDIV